MQHPTLMLQPYHIYASPSPFGTREASEASAPNSPRCNSPSSPGPQNSKRPGIVDWHPVGCVQCMLLANVPYPWSHVSTGFSRWRWPSCGHLYESMCLVMCGSSGMVQLHINIILLPQYFSFVFPKLNHFHRVVLYRTVPQRSASYFSTSLSCIWLGLFHRTSLCRTMMLSPMPMLDPLLHTLSTLLHGVPAVLLVPVPTRTKTGPKSRTWQRGGESRIASLSATTVSLRASVPTQGGISGMNMTLTPLKVKR